MIVLRTGQRGAFSTGVGHPSLTGLNGVGRVDSAISLLETLGEYARLVYMNNWIVADPEHLGGSPRVRGTRISIALILESLGAGLSIAEIVGAYPSLTEESVRGALAELN
jgi:uncharacterized protein (DUF433 family)